MSLEPDVATQRKQGSRLINRRSRYDTDELGAYLDGMLAKDQQTRVAAAIAGNSDLTNLLRHYKRLAASFRKLRYDVLLEPIPPRLMVTVWGGDRYWRRHCIASAIGVIVAALAGLGAGWWVNEMWDQEVSFLHDFLAALPDLTQLLV